MFDRYIYIAAIFVFINLTGFALMGIDKSKARHHVRRVPEKVLFTFVLLGAGAGVYLGCLIFRHKTKHWYFLYGIPFIIFLQLTLLFFII
ncbi:MAG: DUF1294 domain-containing protein [Clostridia bacterium]|nr:DUF1294 domain-containing protein [Clostridia bacterium]